MIGEDWACHTSTLFVLSQLRAPSVNTAHHTCISPSPPKGTCPALVSAQMESTAEFFNHSHAPCILERASLLLLLLDTLTQGDAVDLAEGHTDIGGCASRHQRSALGPAGEGIEKGHNRGCGKGSHSPCSGSLGSPLVGSRRRTASHRCCWRPPQWTSSTPPRRRTTLQPFCPL